MDKEITMPEETKDMIPVTLKKMTPSDLLSILVQKGADLATLEKFMDLKEREEANQARKQYIKAMAAFKANPPEILKQTHVVYDTSKGKTDYRHASLDHVADEINIALSKHGLFASWPQKQTDNSITVTCRITHEDGHYEETSLTAAADMSGGKNAIQGLGSTITYLQRYTILAITGLAAKGMDNDGVGVPAEYITPEMQKEINDLIKSTKADKAKVLKYLKSESVEKILLSDYGKAKVAFESKAKAEKKPMREVGEEG